MKIKRLVLWGVALIMLFSFAGCNSELAIGFIVSERYSIYDGLVTCAVKSKTSKLSADDVMLDFYYGYFKGTSPIQEYGDGQEAEHIGFALYFCNAAVPPYFPFQSDDLVEDYSEHEGLWFVKYIPMEEFVSEDYSISLSEPYKRNIFSQRNEYCDVLFNHNETLTVPQEVLINKSGHFGFLVAGISYDHQKKGYLFSDVYSVIYIKYKYINKETLRLSKPASFQEEVTVIEE